MSKNLLTRREMLKTTAGLAALAWMPSCRKTDSEMTKALSGFKLGVCDWTLEKTADPTALQTAAALGLDGVQISLGTIENHMHLRQEEIQKTYLETARKTGMEMPSIAIGALNSVPLKSEDLAMEWLMDCIVVCGKMNIPNILVPFFGKGDIRGDEAGFQSVISRFKEAAPLAENTGVNLAIESWLSAEEHRRMIDEVGSPAMKVYYDVGNSDKAGYDIYQEIRQLGNLICEFHAKDYQDLYGKGNIRFDEVRKAMDEIQYRGWFVLEGSQFPLGREESIRYDAEYLKTLFPKAV